MAPSRDLLGVPSRSISVRSIAPCSVARAPISALAMSSLTFATALATPLPPQASPPSRSSVASNSPVEAPEGTAARPERPGVERHVDLDRRVAPRVEDLARVDPLDRGHGRGSLPGGAASGRWRQPASRTAGVVRATARRSRDRRPEAQARDELWLDRRESNRWSAVAIVLIVHRPRRNRDRCRVAASASRERRA